MATVLLHVAGAVAARGGAVDLHERHARLAVAVLLPLGALLVGVGWRHVQLAREHRLLRLLRGKRARSEGRALVAVRLAALAAVVQHVDGVAHALALRRPEQAVLVQVDRLARAQRAARHMDQHCDERAARQADERPKLPIAGAPRGPGRRGAPARRAHALLRRAGRHPPAVRLRGRPLTTMATPPWSARRSYKWFRCKTRRKLSFRLRLAPSRAAASRRPAAPRWREHVPMLHGWRQGRRGGWRGGES